MKTLCGYVEAGKQERDRLVTFCHPLPKGSWKYAKYLVNVVLETIKVYIKQQQ